MLYTDEGVNQENELRYWKVDVTQEEGEEKSPEKRAAADSPGAGGRWLREETLKEREWEVNTELVRLMFKDILLTLKKNF